MNILLQTGTSGVGENVSELLLAMKSAFSTFTWLDAVDIFVLSALFFFVLSLFGGKKGGAAMIGIGICLAFWFVSATLKLEGTSFIFSKVYSVGIP